MSETPETAARAAAFYDDLTRSKGDLDDDDLALLGTVTDDAPVVKLRDRLERLHLARAVELRADMRVLDLGGGAGRLALWLAPHVREVVLVDTSAELLAVAEQIAERRGLSNVTTHRAAVQDFVPEGQFDLIIVFGVATYLDLDEIERLAGHVRDALAPGGRFVLKEPVSTDGFDHHDERHDAEGNLTYRATFRPRERYPALLARWFRLTYQRATCAHFFPWFLGGTDDAVEASRGALGTLLLERFDEVLVRLDPYLQDVEDALRAHPLWTKLLAPVAVLSDLYVFAPRPEADARLSVVVIAYDEEACIAPVVEELRDGLVAAGIADHELVLVDDGSADRTLEIMQGLAEDDERVVVRHQENKGIGGALRTGFDAATGDYVTWVPADGQIAPATVVELFERRHEAPMLTTVYRTRDDPWYRMVISNTLNTMIRVRTGQVAKSGGNYLFSREIWERLGPRDDDSMMISSAFRQNIRAAGERIVEVPIDCRARQAGHSKVLNPKAIVRTLRGWAVMAPK